MKNVLLSISLTALVLIGISFISTTTTTTPPEQHSAEPFIGEIAMFGGNFAPRSWALCNGQLLPISQNEALFSLLGTTYGGDGRTTFGLPDLRGRVPIHAGQGPGLSNYQLGQRGGAETVTLTSAEMPSHNHTSALEMRVGSSAPDTADPNGNIITSCKIYSSVKNPSVKLGDGMFTNTIGNTGGNQAHENRPPFQTINYIIALQGTYPSRN